MVCVAVIENGLEYYCENEYFVTAAKKACDHFRYELCHYEDRSVLVNVFSVNFSTGIPIRTFLGPVMVTVKKGSMTKKHYLDEIKNIMGTVPKEFHEILDYQITKEYMKDNCPYEQTIAIIKLFASDINKAIALYNGRQLETEQVN